MRPALAAVILIGRSVTGGALPLVGRDVHGSDVLLAAAAHAVGALLGVRSCPGARGWWARAG